MTILVGSSRIRVPDFSSPTSGVQQLLDQAKQTVMGFLDAAGSRVFTNTFVEDGTQNVVGSSFIDSKFSDLVKPNRRQVISQTPTATVLLKKRMFSTLRSNYDIRFMDDDERIFIRAIKNLFRRKSEEIAFYENLLVLEKVIEDPEFLTLDNFLDKGLLAFFAILDAGFGITNPNDLIGSFLPSLPGFNPAVLFRLKKLQERARQNKLTTWITDVDFADFSGTGPGVGVIELTWMSTISTRTTLETGGGGCTISIEDPYRLTRITESDIDFALKQALAEEVGPVGFFDVAGHVQLENAQSLDVELNEMRRSRGVSEINFEFDPTGGNPFATIVELNLPFTLASLDNIPIEQALLSTEVVRVANIFGLLRSYRSIQDRSVNSVQNSNQRFSIIRQKLRSEFVGHHIIQQMDSMHIFVNSFTRNETPIYENRQDPLNNGSLESILTYKEQLGKLSDEALEAERQVIAPEMSLFEYKAYRNPVEWRGAGPQIFSGLVDSVRSNYTASDGKFKLTVTAKDNIEFLNLSRINVQPSLSQPEGMLEDPLTPYDIVVDPVSGLIIDKQLSETNKRRLPFLKFDDGQYLGEEVLTEDRLIQDTAKSKATDILAYQHVPGLAYKWKQGIMVASQDVNLTQPLSRRRSVLGDTREDFGLTLTNTPFDNLDAADIVSILITGQPYNYNGFLESALQAGNFTIDNDTNNRTYFNHLFDFLERSNPVFGNFIPAKLSNIDPFVVASAFKEQKRLTRLNATIGELQRDKAKLLDQQNSLFGAKDQDAVEIRKKLQDRIDGLTEQINDFANELSASNLDLGDAADVKIYGDAIQVHFKEEEHTDLKKRLQYIVKKKPEEVRYNQDKNYLIISDKYDTDLDIQAFVLRLKSNAPGALFVSDFKKPGEICREVAKVLDFEFFADSQGNIQFRPPQYNKTPLSLLLKMIELGASDGVSLAPPFLLNLLSDRKNLVRDQLLQFELEIFEGGLLLGFGRSELKQRFGIALSVVSDESSLWEINDELLLSSLDQDAVFTEQEQSVLIFSAPANELQREGQTILDPITTVIQIRNQLIDLRGSTVSKQNPNDIKVRQDVESELKKFDVGNPSTYVSRLDVTNKIAQLVTKRQTAAKAYQKLAEEHRQLESTTNLANDFSPLRMLGQMVGIDLAGGIPTFPKFMDDLIENDLANLDGFNSGKRFIIEDDVILSADFSIKTPEITRYDITGQVNLVDFNDVNPRLLWAGAVDFDLWRQFGYRSVGQDTKPFFSDPESQCAPYAVFRLLRQRKEIHSGNLVVVGNEFYQPGDVVYVNNRQMLYYVNSVSHNVDVGTGKFSTSLELKYGHALGEYIPTPLDMIGKTLISNSKRHYGNLKAHRTAVPSADVVHLETLTFPITSDVSETSILASANMSSSTEFDLTNGRLNSLEEKYRRLNFKKASNALSKAALLINKNNQDLTRIEIRSYYVGSASSSYTASMFAAFALKLLAEGLAPMESISLAPNFDLKIGTNQPFNALSNGAQIDSNKIILVPPIDLEKTLTEEQALLRRMPSSQAWASSADVQFGGASGMPINSVDIFLVVDKMSKPAPIPKAKADDNFIKSTGESKESAHSTTPLNTSTSFQDASLPVT